MKKIYFLICLCITAGLLNAQVNNLILKFANGTEKSVQLGNMKNITFSTTTILNINVFSGENTAFAISDIQKMYFVNTTGIAEIAETNDITAYPNPAKEFVNFKNLPIGDMNVDVFNMSGIRVIAGKVISSNQSLDIRFLTEGIYFVKINNQLVKLIKL